VAFALGLFHSRAFILSFKWALACCEGAVIRTSRFLHKMSLWPLCTE